MIGLELIKNNIEQDIQKQLNRIGILYRLHSRIKTADSITEKNERNHYSTSTKLMQDIIGFRVITYFEDDVKLVADYFSNHYIKDNLQYDEPKVNEFNPLRKNLVCRLNGDNLQIFNEVKSRHEELNFIDATFEIQFRTTLSEGWHEVEHNMRYKCKKEWNELEQESRALNGIYATLETSDYTLRNLFNDISYKQYKAHNYSGMIRNKFRLRFKLQGLSNDLLEIFNTDDNIIKRIFKLDRKDLLYKLVNSELRMPITFNNICFLCNYLYIHDERITQLTPSILLDDFKYYFSIE